MVYPGNNTTNNTADNTTEHRAQRPKTVDRKQKNERSPDAEPLYVFPDQQVTGTELRRILQGDSRQARAQAIANLLSFVPWNEIWAQVSLEEVREIFPHLELPAGLRKAWASLLKLPEDYFPIIKSPKPPSTDPSP